MAGFREFFEATDPSGHCWYTFQVDEYVVHVLLDVRTLDANCLDEAEHRGRPLGGQYSAQLHSPHTPPPVGQFHLHVYARNNQIFALNMDGSAHDRSHGTTMPRKVADAIKNLFPDFTVPPNNFIEAADRDAEIVAIATLLNE